MDSICLFLYCTKKDESIRDNCFMDYITYECVYNGMSIVLYEGDTITKGHIKYREESDIVEVGRYILVFGEIYKATGSMIVKEVVENEDVVLYRLLKL